MSGLLKRAKARLKNSLFMEKTFTEIYAKNRWRDAESRSGPGSNLANTKTIRAALPGLLTDFGIRSLLDVPCGDFHWMKELDLEMITYIGGDVVGELIDENTVKFGNEKRRFIILDLRRDSLPQVDMILCRDCLVHLSFTDVFRALSNIQKSGAHYLLTTTFTQVADNDDIVTGKWRPLNLQKAPFNFPEPMRIINENYMGDEGRYADKSLGLWKMEDIKAIPM